MGRATVTADRPESRAGYALAPDDPPQPTRPAAEPRLLSLDTYRGLIMISLAFVGFGLAETARRHLAEQPDSRVWQEVGKQFEHAEWVGCNYWDLIQPSFMFMVGLSMAYSYAKRRSLGQSYGRMLGHAVWRSLVLIVLGIFLISNGQKSTSWSLMNVLTQIGLGYTFLFLLWGRKPLVQALAAIAILVGTWVLYVTYPAASSDPLGANESVGVSAEWAEKHHAGVGRPWHKNANVGHAIDLWLLNKLPQREPFQFSKGGYQTINFLPSLATMLFGLMAGELLRSPSSQRRKLLLLISSGVACLVIGQALDSSGLCPLVKRLWTPSWAIFSTGWCCLILAGLYLMVDVLKLRRWTWPLVIVGMNSIAIYVMSMLLKPWAAKTLRTHLGDDVFQLKIPLLGLHEPLVSNLYEPTVQATLVGLCFWLACWWMYRQKIFIRI